MTEDTLNLNERDFIVVGELDFLHVPANEGQRADSFLIPEFRIVEDIFMNRRELIFLGTQTEEVLCVWRKYPL